MSRSSTYGGFDRVVAQMEGRRDPFTFGPDEALPPLDTDFAPLKARLIGDTPEPYLSSKTSFAYKVRALHDEFEDQPQLLWLHGLLIANLRRRAQPAQTTPLFLRLWQEEPDYLLAHLDPRWLVSAITTFADHGANEIQRRVGHSLTVLFSTMKLYETERLHSPAAPSEPFSGKRRQTPLALEMDAYAVVGGGLDVNMLGRLWQDAGEDPIIRPLAQHLLNLLDSDDRTVFRRLRLMRAAREDKRDDATRDLFFFNTIRDKSQIAPVPRKVAQTDPPSWGIVSTVRAPLAQIARFAAYHLAEGAAQVTLYLDDPSLQTQAFFASEPRISVIQCDDTYWTRHRNGRPDTHQGRQMRNATHAYRRSALDWLAHIDVDEYLMPPRNMAGILAQLPANIAVLQFRPAEQLAGSEDHFKLTPRFAGQDKSVLSQIYPTFGSHLRGGYISHLEGKPIVRTGIEGARLGIHTLLYNGAPAANRAELLDGWLGHDHAQNWPHFRERLEFRMTMGSYRRSGTGFGLFDVLEFLKENEGEDGLRQFYEEVCADSPALRKALSDHGMLYTRALDLEARCRAIFGALPA